MSLKKEEKAEIIKQHAKNAKDSGSVEVQIAILTAEITKLSTHLIKNKFDNQGKRIINIWSAKRRALLKYLKNQSVEDYAKLINKLKIRDVI